MSLVARARLVVPVPVPTPGYQHRIPPVKTFVPGPYTVGSAQIVDGTLNAEQTLELPEGAWRQLARTPDRAASDLVTPTASLSLDLGQPVVLPETWRVPRGQSWPPARHGRSVSAGP